MPPKQVRLPNAWQAMSRARAWIAAGKAKAKAKAAAKAHAKAKGKAKAKAKAQPKAQPHPRRGQAGFAIPWRGSPWVEPPYLRCLRRFGRFTAKRYHGGGNLHTQIALYMLHIDMQATGEVLSMMLAARAPPAVFYRSVETYYSMMTEQVRLGSCTRTTVFVATPTGVILLV